MCSESNKIKTFSIVTSHRLIDPLPNNLAGLFMGVCGVRVDEGCVVESVVTCVSGSVHMEEMMTVALFVSVQ